MLISSIWQYHDFFYICSNTTQCITNQLGKTKTSLMKMKKHENWISKIKSLKNSCKQIPQDFKFSENPHSQFFLIFIWFELFLGQIKFEFCIFQLSSSRKCIRCIRIYTVLHGFTLASYFWSLKVVWPLKMKKWLQFLSFFSCFFFLFLISRKYKARRICSTNVWDTNRHD